MIYLCPVIFCCGGNLAGYPGGGAFCKKEKKENILYRIINFAQLKLLKLLCKDNTDFYKILFLFFQLLFD